MRDIFAEAGVIPVLVFEDAAHAVPTATALFDGGLTVLEVTLRTAAAWGSVEKIAARFPEAPVGVGTVLEPDQLHRARDAGAIFAVSPGFDPALAETAREVGMFYLPGVATASEVMAARRAGLRFLKFFPAEASGGVAALNAFVSPFGGIDFCPTGGIGPGNLADYLGLSNVACVGGSWMATAKDMAEGDWAGITEKAIAARNACDDTR